MNARDELVVLKFGSSVLRDASDLPRVVRSVQRRLDAGQRVLAVVSAFGDETDRLLDAYRTSERERGDRDAGGAAADGAPSDGGDATDSAERRASDHALAAWLAKGERRGAELVADALEERGVSVARAEPEDGCVRARGPVLDAASVTVDRAAFERLFERAEVCVLPGFFALHDDGTGSDARAVCLLGRGGSDFTAVACAGALGAAHCLLLKDVDGLYDRDPGGLDGSGRRYRSLTFDDAATIDGRVLQPKAVRWAAAHRTRFEVGDDGSLAPTLVGAEVTRFDDE